MARQTNISRFENEVGKKFTIGGCDYLTWFLSSSFNVSAERLSLRHSTYIRSLLTKFGMENCKSISTRLAEKLTPSKDDSHVTGSDGEKQMKRLDYRALVGSLSYLAQTTRPDLAFFRDSSAVPDNSLASSNASFLLPQRNS